MPDFGSQVAHYLALHREGRCDDAFFGLLDLTPDALPALIENFRLAADPSDRAFLLHVLWQHRHPSAVPVLAEALFDAEPTVWREALDGLVALASPAARDALRTALRRTFLIAREQEEFNDWLSEAIEQAECSGACMRLRDGQHNLLPKH